jgi:S-methylmethionine-dependent homocysteine/selenocysteine methylase
MWPVIKEAARVGVAQDIFGRLAEGDVVVIDGGMGTQLQVQGAPMDDEIWSARASLEHPELVQSAHEAYIRAGAEVIITNTFTTNRAALEPAGLGDRVADANRNAVRAALRAREAIGRPAAVAGSMSSFCVIAMHGLGDAAADSDGAEDPRFPSLANYREQAALLADEGVDFIALELMDAPGYGRAAIQAAVETGLPVWLGVSPVRNDDGSLAADPVMGTGLSLAELLAQLVTPELAAVTVMHAKPDVAGEAIAAVRESFGGPIGVYAESGDWEAPNWVFNGLSPDEYLLEADSWVSQGAQIIGGCCGVGPEHIRVLADRLARPAARRS